MNARVRSLSSLFAIALVVACGGSPEHRDGDAPVVGTGLPAGWSGRADGSAAVSAIAWSDSGGAAVVRTGPAFIAWRAADTASGAYRVSATLRQLAPYKYFEASGVFLGGADLEAETQRYLYFLVRGDGMFLVKVREGATTRDVIPWTTSAAVAKLDAAGTATWPLAVHVAADSVRFFVGDQPVATVGAAGLPVTGHVGVRINHNLQVRLEGPVITR